MLHFDKLNFKVKQILFIFHKMYITLDIGGTRCRIAYFSNLAKDSLIKVEHSDTANDYQADMSKICGYIRNNISEPVHGIAMGIAGSLNADKSMLNNSPNLSSWEGHDLKGEFTNEFSCPAFAENDTFMAATGEAAFGGHHQDFWYINWGTGIGGSLVKITDHDYQVIAAEPGHQIIVAQGLECRCGQRGCLESYTGGFAMEQLYHTAPEKMKWGQWKEVLTRMGHGLVNILACSPTELVVFNGGVAFNQHEKIRMLADILKEQLQIISMPEIKLSKLQDMAGLYGGIAYLKKALPA